MEKVIFTHFRQKRKTLVKRNVLGTFFSTRIAKTRFSHFWEQKSENVLIFHFWGAFGAQNAPERKSGPKSGKSAFERFGLQKRAQNVTFITVLRSERK